MKLSWRGRIIFIIMATVAGAIIVTWILNHFFLESYYIEKKIKTLESAYTTVEMMLEKYQVKDDGNNSASVGEIKATACTYEQKKVINTTAGRKKDDFAGEFRPNGENSRQGDIVEINPSTDSDNFLSEDDALYLQILSERSNLTIYILKELTYYFSTSNGNGKENVFFEKIRDALFNSHDRKYGEIVLRTGDGYVVNRVYDYRTDSSYIDLFSASADAGTFILIRTNVESMSDSADIANGFLLYAGSFVLILALFIIMFTSRTVVKPIRKLSDIARSVSQLDFDVRYEGEANDEIGKLGESINVMSEKLEKTISNLKSANNALQSDIDKRTQIDEMRKEFLSNVTHELKTPIALISGYAEGLKECINDDAESRDFYCDVIIDEADKMNKMVKKLLTLNQLEFGQQALEMERFNLSDMIRSVVGSSDVLLKEKDIHLLLNVPETLEAWADEYLIEEVFTNYLTNAINYCSNEMIIDVKAEKTEHGTRVSVFNTGEPIPNEDIEKIWIKFYKVDKARSREYGGTGIGLSIVKAIMEAHNRPFGVINHSNGVEFWFEIG